MRNKDRHQALAQPCIVWVGSGDWGSPWNDVLQCDKWMEMKMKMFSNGNFVLRKMYRIIHHISMYVHLLYTNSLRLCSVITRRNFYSLMSVSVCIVCFCVRLAVCVCVSLLRLGTESENKNNNWVYHLLYLWEEQNVMLALWWLPDNGCLLAGICI